MNKIGAIYIVKLFVLRFGDRATKQVNITSIPLTQIKKIRNAIHEDIIDEYMVARMRAINKIEIPRFRGVDANMVIADDVIIRDVNTVMVVML